MVKFPADDNQTMAAQGPACRRRKKFKLVRLRDGYAINSGGCARQQRKIEAGGADARRSGSISNDTGAYAVRTVPVADVLPAMSR